ncbi:MAG: cob(I)yrinic acid a,c-diamide adenosyltransferase [Eubacteriales bacterium]
MERGMVHVYCGDGQGKTSAALGRALQAANESKNVVIIQFLKGLKDTEFLKQLAPAIKIFRFEKTEGNFADLSKEEQAEEIKNIKNALNFAKKVLTTGECELLILDEVLLLLEHDIIAIEDLKVILDARMEHVDVVLTGIHMKDEICALVDGISNIDTVKYKVW